MKIRPGRYAFSVIAIVVVVVTLARVATAPERIKARLETAQSTCVSSGGKWTTENKQFVCVRS